MADVGHVAGLNGRRPHGPQRLIGHEPHVNLDAIFLLELFNALDNRLVGRVDEALDRPERQLAALRSGSRRSLLWRRRSGAETGAVQAAKTIAITTSRLNHRKACMDTSPSSSNENYVRLRIGQCAVGGPIPPGQV